jgi:hypothetical protein
LRALCWLRVAAATAAIASRLAQLRRFAAPDPNRAINKNHGLGARLGPRAKTTRRARGRAYLVRMTGPIVRLGWRDYEAPFHPGRPVAGRPVGRSCCARFHGPCGPGFYADSDGQLLRFWRMRPRCPRHADSRDIPRAVHRRDGVRRDVHALVDGRVQSGLCHQ